jgi:hypothetical protein
LIAAPSTASRLDPLPHAVVLQDISRTLKMSRREDGAWQEGEHTASTSAWR